MALFALWFFSNLLVKWIEIKTLTPNKNTADRS